MYDGRQATKRAREQKTLDGVALCCWMRTDSSASTGVGTGEVTSSFRVLSTVMRAFSEVSSKFCKGGKQGKADRTKGAHR